MNLPQRDYPLETALLRPKKLDEVKLESGGKTLGSILIIDNGFCYLKSLTYLLDFNKTSASINRDFITALYYAH